MYIMSNLVFKGAWEESDKYFVKCNLAYLQDRCTAIIMAQLFYPNNWFFSDWNDLHPNEGVGWGTELYSEYITYLVEKCNMYTKKARNTVKNMSGKRIRFEYDRRHLFMVVAKNEDGGIAYFQSMIPQFRKIV